MTDKDIQSEEFERKVEGMLLGDEQDTGEHPAVGGVIENSGWTMLGNGSPEHYRFPFMQVDPPGPNRKIRWEAPDGTMHEQDAPPAQKYLFTAPKPVEMDEQRIRAIVREEVHRALYPVAEMANPHEHRRIEMTEESGRKWRGVLYLVEKESEM